MPVSSAGRWRRRFRRFFLSMLKRVKPTKRTTLSPVLWAAGVGAAAEQSPSDRLRAKPLWINRGLTWSLSPLLRGVLRPTWFAGSDSSPPDYSPPAAPGSVPFSSSRLLRRLSRLFPMNQRGRYRVSIEGFGLPRHPPFGVRLGAGDATQPRFGEATFPPKQRMESPPSSAQRQCRPGCVESPRLPPFSSVSPDRQTTLRNRGSSRSRRVLLAFAISRCPARELPMLISPPPARSRAPGFPSVVLEIVHRLLRRASRPSRKRVRRIDSESAVHAGVLHRRPGRAEKRFELLCGPVP